MRIALVAWEFAGGSNGGGIGTYLRIAADMLAAAGHDVEVFTSTAKGEVTAKGYMVHAISCARQTDFAQDVVECFAARHKVRPFDVLEGAEFGADARVIARSFPDLPIVIKLHTPTSLISRIALSYVPLLARMRPIIGALKRGSMPSRMFRIDPQAEANERSLTLRANLVTAPSQAILDLVGNKWDLPADRRLLVPNAFVPPKELLAIESESNTRNVLYVGRLEVRKGVLELADAIPRICARRPDTRFVFLGRTLPMPGARHDVKEEMLRRIGSWRTNVDFIEAVPYSKIGSFYAEADIVALPSIWENFPNTCLEAMSAARGVIGSSAGGMTEMIEDGRTGLLVPPRAPRAIAEAVLGLLKDPNRRIEMGRAARESVVHRYSSEAILPLQLTAYKRAIANVGAGAVREGLA